MNPKAVTRHLPPELQLYKEKWKGQGTIEQLNDSTITHKYSGHLFSLQQIVTNGIGYTVDLDSNGDLLLAIVMNGQGQLIIDDACKTPVITGTAFIQPVSKLMILPLKGIIEMLIIHPGDELTKEAEKFTSGRINENIANGCNFIQISPDMYYRLRKFENDFNQNSAEGLLFSAEIIQLIFAITHHHNPMGEPGKSLPKSPHVEAAKKAFHHINENRNVETCRVNCLAKKFHTRPQTLSKYFLEIYGKKIKEYIIESVMEKATLLLGEGQMTIQEISDELGYSTSSNFTRAFTDYFSVVPTETRKTYKNTGEDLFRILKNEKMNKKKAKNDGTHPNSICEI